ncbi:hypothetical protein [Mycobacterium xenopi]|uniref:Uncharacterized protein n=2 Tax=Mycobacterium xenopi TaxID=1789 RepID=A0AAD1GXP9_MYCXE|nr:hypothetical protein [Mycobacterium xenopi]EUA23033.1 hypothetical protein I553_5650 [Mycobacterium xenopi 4042]EUA52056.1 hypothetical protein I552_3003 [Mycobacterium xenopi 3993]MDA3641613.1 hypothetical protein [Mycobacterium xenopi]MDA3659371.1 hypothetical protein [Mycobacterium xenopi]MDA3663877.1 hypothetical protein [Mycobacterium xenopi]
MRPRIIQRDGQIGFYWATPDNRPTSLPKLIIDDEEPDRLVATHLEALDDALIIAAGRFGDLLGGGKRPDDRDRQALIILYRRLDHLCREFAQALELTNMTADLRAGKIIGTAALFSIRARQPLGLLGPPPLDAELDDPPIGVVSGFGRMCYVDPANPWKGARWVLESETGQRFPLTLSMLLFDSSGVNKDAARREHREAIEACIAASCMSEADPFVIASALDWLLYDWLMAHREDPDSAAIQIPKGYESDAVMIVTATAASVTARARFDPGLAA